MENLNYLTPQQTKVYKFMLTKLTYEDMQKELSLLPGGLRCHVGQVLEKLCFKSRFEMVCQEYAENDKYTFINYNFVSNFTEFENDVFNLTVNGFAVQETADVLKVTRSSVRYARARVFKLAGVRSSFDLIYKCYGVK